MELGAFSISLTVKDIEASRRFYYYSCIYGIMYLRMVTSHGGTDDR